MGPTTLPVHMEFKRPIYRYAPMESGPRYQNRRPVPRFAPPPLTMEVCKPVPSNVDTVSVEDEEEVDEHKINQRMKQIKFGYATQGHINYLREVPLEAREELNEDHPVTPRATMKCSKRTWDSKLKQWRRALHKWDTPSEDGISEEDSSDKAGSETCSVDQTPCTLR
eukprot:NODE_2465_length_529_cov_92.089583_g1917_i0.p1 GENE.NODE_2465_length_529_cov_92.089583_g1917_i0~~NODE_2465_length_529_cov_92.089583_g1917_i0.p1  ORF type:complete len:175 (+),score=53.89 NODE_2465_length_529_cov_92.089583_g1917_i0:25-525(+)